MKPSLLAALAGAIGTGLSQSVTEKPDPEKVTRFDSLPVPPLLELTPSNWDAEVNNSKFMMVKHFSPYCPHCVQFAPTYQTLFEFYYTSSPVGHESTSFVDYYDFRFASVNCVAYYDLCIAHDVQTYPTTVLYVNGEPKDSVRGGKTMETLSGVIEGALEDYKPGSRPKQISLPKAGADKAPPPPPPTSADEDDDGAPASKTATTSGKPNENGLASTTTKQSTSWYGAKWDTQTSAELFREKTPKKPTVTSNPEGNSVPLTAENFQKLVTLSQEPWFVKFYAPWCSHCQAMAPSWQQLAKVMEGKLNIGEVNCEKERRLCRDVGAKAFPTLLFFKGGERAEYRGLRGLGDFKQYAEKALDLASGIPDVDAKTFKEMEEKEEVIFVYFYDHATTTEDFTALERIPLSLIGHAKLVKTNDPKLFDRFKITTWPRLMVSREGRPTYYTPLTPGEMRDVRGVLAWMKSVWLPLVPELTAANARQIMEGKVVVLGILNRDEQSSFQTGLHELKTAAGEWMDRQIQEYQLDRKKLRDSKQMRIEEAEDRDDQRALRAAKTIRIDMENLGHKEVLFAWVDGVFWQRWIRTTFGIDVKDGERVIINEQDRRRYWDSSVTGNYILVSRTSIMETLDKVISNPHSIRPKLTISSFEKIFFDIRLAFREHPYLSTGCVLGIGLVVLTYLRTRRRTRSYFKLEDAIGIRELKDGLLGQNGNAKAD